MNRKEFLALVSVFLLNARLPTATAASGPSLKPTRMGQTVIWRGKKYTAVKSRGKLIWNKGVAIPSPRPSSTPSPRPPLPSVAEINLGASREVPDGETRVFYPKDPNARGKAFFITREKGALIAFDTACTHEGCQVQLGIPRLLCGCHMSIFNRVTGAVEGGPARRPLRSYPVKEVSGRIIVTNSV